METIKEEKKADFRVGFNWWFWLFIWMFIGVVIAECVMLYMQPERETRATKQECIQLFNSLN